jgi:PAS domain S-box-containing protein
MWVTKLDRKRNFVNRAYVDFLGITYEEAVDFDWRTVLHPDDHDRIVAQSIAGEASMKPFVLEARYLRADGEWRWVYSISQPRWGADGEHIGFIGVAHDITEAKQAEAALRGMNETLERRVEERTADLSAALDRLRDEVAERERAEEALRQAQKMEAVGTLTAGIAHNFNNMLGAILPSLEILQRSANDRDAMLISDALHAGYRAADMVRHLMTFSGQRRARTEIPCDPAIVVRQALAMCRGTIESHVTLEERVEPSLPAVLCDEGALEQVLVNLVLNARDAVLEARRAAPRIEISASLAMRARGGNSSLARTRFVCFRVSDNGTGIADAVRSRLFEPFVTTKVPGKGTGLGLAVSYAIAKDHHGFIEVESRPYLGATFSLYLPTCDAAAQSTESVYPAEDAARPARLLVVDDDDAVRSIVERLLRSAGHAVWTASGARHALVVLAETAPIDLVFLDRAMPDRPGSAIVDDIRRLAPRAKIVYLTGQDVPVHERRVVEDVLYKPVTRAALLEVVARLVT